MVERFFWAKLHWLTKAAFFCRSQKGGQSQRIRKPQQTEARGSVPKSKIFLDACTQSIKHLPRQSAPSLSKKPGSISRQSAPSLPQKPRPKDPKRADKTYGDYDWKTFIEKNALSSLTLSILRLYLEKHHLKLSKKNWCHSAYQYWLK